MESATASGALAKKLVAAMKEIDAVEKRGTNEKQNYKYVKAADVAHSVRPVLVAHGIGFSYSVLSTERWEKQTHSGGIMFFVEMRVRFRFTDSETGDFLEADGIGWGMDSGDKAPYKAMTGALKYGLRMNFIIPDELDPENDAPERKDVRQTQASHDAEPVFDEYGDPVTDTRPQPKPQPAKPNGHANGGALITEKQAGLIWAVGIRNRGKDALMKFLGDNGWEHCREIPKAKFDMAKTWAGVEDNRQ